MKCAIEREIKDIRKHVAGNKRVSELKNIFDDLCDEYRARVSLEEFLARIEGANERRSRRVKSRDGAGVIAIIGQRA